MNLWHEYCAKKKKLNEGGCRIGRDHYRVGSCLMRQPFLQSFNLLEIEKTTLSSGLIHQKGEGVPPPGGYQKKKKGKSFF